MFALFVSAVVIGMAGGPAPEGHSGLPVGYWTLSANPSDPGEVGSEPWLGARDLYLWFDCWYGEVGLSRFHMTLETAGLELNSFTPMNGFASSGTLPSIELAHDSCPTGFVLAGVLSVTDPTGQGGTICPGPGRIVEDCQVPPLATDAAVVGFTSLFPHPCSFEFCPVDLILPDHWGQVKAKYR